MNAVILYDDYKVGSKANAMLSEASYRADAGLPWNISCWPMDMLMRWPAADDALHDAVSAHLIVIAVRNQVELPPRLLKWLETWAEHRHVHDAALAVFDSWHGDARFSPPSPVLVHFAERHGLCFIFGDANPDEDELAQASTTVQILEHPEEPRTKGDRDQGKLTASMPWDSRWERGEHVKEDNNEIHGQQRH